MAPALAQPTPDTGAGAAGPHAGWTGFGGLLLFVALGAALRLPFLLESLFLPIDGDTAIIGLMARNRVWSGTMWGQPYGSPVESWMALPFVELLGPTRLAIRLSYFALSVALVPLAWALARAVDRRAGLPAAALLACPPAVFLAYAALPPPLYPTAIFLVGSLLVVALAAARALPQPGARYLPLIAVWTTLSALALWTHLVSAAAVGASALLLLSQTRSRPARAAVVVLAGCIVGAATLLTAAREPGSVQIAASTLGHARAILPVMYLPLSELIGGRVWVVSAGDYEVVAPALIQVALACLYVAGAFLAVKARARAATLTLAAALVLSVSVFPFPIRTGIGGVRFLTPAYLPLAALVAVGATARLGRAAWVPILLLIGLHTMPLPGLLGHWHAARDSSAFFPDCSDGRQAMEMLGLRRGYASYNMAYCITWESGEEIIVSQPWNERFVHHPLPYVDEVRFAGSAIAWMLRPEADYRLPSPAEFERHLRRSGGEWDRYQQGETIVYHSFVPPFSSTVVPLPEAGVAGDGDPATRVVEAARGPSTYRVDPPRPLAGITLLGGTRRPFLPRSMKVEVSEDGSRFQKALRRRRNRERVKLTWLNGQPQYPFDDRAISVALGGQPVAAFRITPLVNQGAWSLSEVLLHEEPATAPWPPGDGLDATWAERRHLLRRHPRPHDAGWQYRMLLAADKP